MYPAQLWSKIPQIAAGRDLALSLGQSLPSPIFLTDSMLIPIGLIDSVIMNDQRTRCVTIVDFLLFCWSSWNDRE